MDEGSGGLGRAVSNGAGAVKHKVLLNPCCQILIPTRHREALLRQQREFQD